MGITPEQQPSELRRHDASIKCPNRRRVKLPEEFIRMEPQIFSELDLFVRHHHRTVDKLQRAFVTDSQLLQLLGSPLRKKKIRQHS